MRNQKFANILLRVLPIAALTIAGTVGVLNAQTPKDPGIRPGAAGAGKPIAGLTPGELDFFNNVATPQFVQVEDVPNDGLGPRFNLDSCAGCHVQPATGGSSPLTNNPQFVRAGTMATHAQLANLPFITQNGPIREARFVRNQDGTLDGGVHDLFVITGRADTPAGCTITQPNFAQAIQEHNIIFRIPTPVFGGGLIDAIPDTTIKNNVASDPDGRKRAYGIHGKVNTNGNDGTVTRFGWKAQNKSLLIFAGEAYNVEMGITNENFQTERDETPACNPLAAPNNTTTMNVGSNSASDIVAFMGFMKFLDQPTPVTSFGTVTAASIQNGKALFSTVGCVLCHTPSLSTGPSSTKALANQTVNLYSDLSLHDMGPGLADGVHQGNANGRQFRTAPLWGVGQRAFFLHDGRTSDLLTAILALDSGSDGEDGEGNGGQVSEAHHVIQNFKALSNSQQQDILNFLRSL